MVNLSGTILNQLYGQLKDFYRQLPGLNVARELMLPLCYITNITCSKN